MSKRLYRKLEVYELYLADLDYETNLVQGAADLGVDLVTINLASDNKERRRLITLIFIPVDETTELEIDLLQIYTELDRGVSENQKAGMLTILNAINIKGSLGAFGINENNKVYSKAVIVDAKQELFEEAQIVDTVQLMEYTMNVFTPLLDEYLDGNFTAQEVINAL
jgi:hypothetical protein